ncbi:MAG TPA: hypothetical protein VIT65_09955 [Microlunatus sp.]|jgi:hypothetical protein
MTGFVELLVLITVAVSVTALVIAGAAHLGAQSWPRLRRVRRVDQRRRPSL